jgi:hydroxymethylpyrimidine kinase/phosphomethylpyrimidine kinase
MTRLANVLSIAGSDPSGGAGIQADLKTFAALGCYGMAAITALTVQNTRGVRAVHVPAADFVAQQVEALFDDIEIDAVKIGMLGTGEIVTAVAEVLARRGARNIVLDPVLVATSGDSLGSADVVEAMQRSLIPLATLVTPNIPEAMRFTGAGEPATADDLAAMAQAMLGQGARAVLVKGGHLEGDQASDILFDACGLQRFDAPRIATRNTHGTGCTLSSAIAAELAKGAPLARAVAAGKAYLTEALRSSAALEVGHGHGPVNHLWPLGRR